MGRAAGRVGEADDGALGAAGHAARSAFQGFGMSCCWRYFVIVLGSNPVASDAALIDAPAESRSPAKLTRDDPALIVARLAHEAHEPIAKLSEPTCRRVGANGVDQRRRNQLGQWVTITQSYATQRAVRS